DRILRHQVVQLKEGANKVAWDVDGAQFPNCTLTATRMAGTRFDEARLDVRVERDLRVAVEPARETVAPGGGVEVEVTTPDPIGPFFYDQTRTGAFATTASNTFRYQPASVPVPEAVVEEDEAKAAATADELAADDARRKAKSGLALGVIVQGHNGQVANAPEA